MGREILERELKRRRLVKPEDVQLEDAARALSQNDSEHLVASIGHGDLNVNQVIRVLYPEEAEQPEPPKQRAIDWFVEKVRGAPKGVSIQGVEGMMVRYAQCCQPVPGDKVVGYVTRGRGVSIHRGDCPNLLTLTADAERRLDIDWQGVEGERFSVRLTIEGNDRRGLYADVAAAVSATGTDIRSFDMRTEDGKVTGAIMVDVENLAQLQKILKSARRVKGVTEIARRERVTSEPVEATE